MMCYAKEFRGGTTVVLNLSLWKTNVARLTALSDLQVYFTFLNRDVCHLRRGGM